MIAEKRGKGVAVVEAKSGKGMAIVDWQRDDDSGRA